MELISAGSMKATVAQQPVLMGHLSVQTALEALQGEEVGANVVVDTVIIDAENCAEYLK